MFFSTYVLTKKGPLAKVWLAAHWDKRLTRHEVKVVNLTQTIVHIIRPVVPIALRTSGELLVGVVRIYALKVKHLLREANEAVLLLRMASITVKSSGVQRLSAEQQQQQQQQQNGKWVLAKEMAQGKTGRLSSSSPLAAGEVQDSIEYAGDEEERMRNGLLLLPGAAGAERTNNNNINDSNAAALYQSEVHAVTYDWGTSTLTGGAAAASSSSSLFHGRSEGNNITGAAAAAAGGAQGHLGAMSDEAAFRAIADLLQPGSLLPPSATSTTTTTTGAANANAAPFSSSSAAAGVGGVSVTGGNTLTAWYTMEPSSQDAAFASSTYASQTQAYDEIARMRADLMAMQQHQHGGGGGGAARESSTSQSSSSLARGNAGARGLGSIELARGSAGGLYGLNGHPLLPYPSAAMLDEELDIGVPLPELEEALPGQRNTPSADREGERAGRPSGFPFYNALTDTATATATATNVNAPTPAAHHVMMPLIDLTSTTLPRAVVEKTMKECGDIVLKAPRRGPYTMDELQDHSFVVALSTNNTTNTNTTSYATNAPQTNSASNETWLRLMPRTLLSRSMFAGSGTNGCNPLCEAYGAALDKPLQETCAALRARLQARKAALTHRNSNNNDAALRHSANMDDLPAENLEAFLSAMNTTIETGWNEGRLSAAGLKRPREHSSGSSSSSFSEQGEGHAQTALLSLSTTANRTLQRIRAQIEHNAITSSTTEERTNNKRPRREESSTTRRSDTSGPSCTLAQVCAGLRRREAARTFVDILALASCSLLRAEEEEDNEKSSETRTRTLHEGGVRLTLRETVNAAAAVGAAAGERENTMRTNDVPAAVAAAA